MKRNNIRFTTALLAIITFFQTGCKKFIEIAPPVTQVSGASVFSDSSAAIAALTGIYGELVNRQMGLASAGTTIFGGLLSDEFTNFSPEQARSDFPANSLQPANNYVSQFWNELYARIYAANSIIEGLELSSAISPGLKNQITGEAKFLRAFLYFYLATLYGDVPLITTTDYRTNTTIPRTAKADVFEKIIEDLKEAENLLRADYSVSNGERARVNKFAASALLARVYLTTGKWDNAELASTKVINNSSTYTLLTNLNDVFLKNSQEAIWQLTPRPPLAVNSFNTYEGYAFIALAVPTDIALTNNLLNAFEASDDRESNWVGNITVAGNTFYFPYKYKVKQGGTALEYYMVLRLAEQYLIRAEARAQQNKIPEAQSDLNAIRSRAHLSNTPAADKASLLLAVEQERRVELFAEWGHRWFDLIRTNRAGAVLSSIKGANWQSTDVLWPIPNAQITSNPNTTQNPGY